MSTAISPWNVLVAGLCGEMVMPAVSLPTGKPEAMPLGAEPLARQARSVRPTRQTPTERLLGAMEHGQAYSIDELQKLAGIKQNGLHAVLHALMRTRNIYWEGHRLSRRYYLAD